MDSDDEQRFAQSNSKQHAALRSDLSAALAAFDRAQDWADLIHDLQRVNRVLNRHPPAAYLPEKNLLAKRLAQCLTSFLPSGVHLKALETYHLIFNRIGPSRLARDLPLYAGGLFPLLSYCSTSLKAPLLSLYETHFLPLGLALCPVLDGFVLAILPGLEEESSEFYSRSRKLLDRIAEAVQDTSIFAKSLWKALLTSPPMRLAASQYLRTRLASGHEGNRAEMVTDMPLVAYAMTSALSDENTLTQRSVLDLLLGQLSLNSQFFKCDTPENRDAVVALVGGVFGAVTRREISLTKRVHAWLLGGHQLEKAISFCNEHSKDLVLAALDSEIKLSLQQTHKTPRTATKPIRIVTALTQRDELSQCLGHLFALRILQYGMLAIVDKDNPHEKDLHAAIADLVQDLGSARVFAELEKTVSHETNKNDKDFKLLAFALSMFPTKNDVIRKQHLPKLLQVAVNSLSAESTDSHTLDKAVEFCSKAVVAMNLSKDFEMNDGFAEAIKNTVGSFASFFVAWLAHVIDRAPAELRRAYSAVTDAEEHEAELRMSSVCETRKECISLARGACSFFVTVASSGIGGEEVIFSSLQATAKCANAADVRISLAGARSFAEISAYAYHNSFVDSGHEEQALGVIRRCWRQMHPSLRTATPQSAQVLLRLQACFPMESKIVIADGILSQDLSRRLRNLERFACLWRLAVEHRLLPLPADNHLFLMLDALVDEDWGPKMLARSWLSDALEVDVASVIDAPLRLLLTPESWTGGRDHEFAAVYDAPRALYGFQVMRAILESFPAMIGSSSVDTYALSSPRKAMRGDGKRGRTGIQALAATAPTPQTAPLLAATFDRPKLDSVANAAGGSSEGTDGLIVLKPLLPARNYIITIAITCLGYLRGRLPERLRRKIKLSPSSDPEDDTSNDSNSELDWILAGLGPRSLEEQHDGVCAAAAECLATLLTSIPVPSQLSIVVSDLLAQPILALVAKGVGAADPIMVLHFLNAMTFLVTANGPTYMSSFLGKDAFTRSDGSSVRIPSSESQAHLQSLKNMEQSSQPRTSATVESLDEFVPWILKAVSSMCSPSRGHDSGSQEVLGVRRKWTRFMETVIRHIGAKLAATTEGLLLILLQMLDLQNVNNTREKFSGDSDFSRVDETLVLLEGINVVSANTLWSFEHALGTGELRDDTQAGQPIQSSGLTFFGGTETEQRGHELGSGGQQSVGSFSGAEKDDRNITAHEPMTNGSNATATMMNAINPLRMINDFVKDVLTGSGSDGASILSDPRRSACRVIFNLLPSILERTAMVWGPTEESRGPGNSAIRDIRIQGSHGPPRLSAELPRERRQAQREAALSVVEPLFQLRPTDVIASIILLFCEEQDAYGSMPEISVYDRPCRMASDLLHALDFATPDIVVASVKRIFDKAVKWDYGTPEAVEGKAQIALRRQARNAIQELISSASHPLNSKHIEAVGQMKLGGVSSPLAGGTEGLDLSQPVFPTANKLTTTHDEVFHWGDFFAQFSSVVIETACLNFLEYFLLTCSDGDDVQVIWPVLHTLLKDSVSGSRRRCTLPASLRVLGAFVSKNAGPFPDRKYRKEIMTTAAMVISSCSSLASGSLDISAEEQHGIPAFTKELAIVSLQALASTVPKIVDSCFLEDKPQLSAAVNNSLTPAVSTLKRAAGRAASIRIASENSKKQRGGEADVSPTRKAEDALTLRMSKASANVLLQTSSRDWGVRFARRELVSLLDDPNFFYAKEDGVLQQMSDIVREVMASGSAGHLLSSIGATSANGTPGIPNIFGGRDSETVMRARTIRRIAFCVFVSEPDFYSPQLPAIQEKIRDALRLGDPSLVAECLLCLRALLVQTGPTSISAFRATTLSEMFRIASNSKENLNVTMAALKFLDLVTLLAPPDFGFETCFFFGDQEQLQVEVEEKVKPFTPLASKLALLWTDERKDVESMFKPPFRLEKGRTVLPGNVDCGVDEELIGRYAAALQARNSIAKMKAGGVDRETVCRELELEFLM